MPPLPSCPWSGFHGFAKMIDAEHEGACALGKFAHRAHDAPGYCGVVILAFLGVTGGRDREC
jgi:hypothetical protein